MRPFEVLEELESYVMRNLKKTQAAFSCYCVSKDGHPVRVFVGIHPCEVEGGILVEVAKLAGVRLETIEVDVITYDHEDIGEHLASLQSWYDNHSFPTPSVEALEALWNK